MSTCKWCGTEIFWTQEKSVMGEVWRAYEDEDNYKRHQCSDYKPKSDGLKSLQRACREQRDKEWNAAKLDIKRFPGA